MPTIAAPSQEEVRRRNLGALLRYVHIHGATSRAELTDRLGLNRSTIGALTADLAAAGLISEETPRKTGRAGRPSLVVRPRTSRVYAYALSIEVDRLRAARVGLGGKVLDSRAADRPRGMQILDTIGPLTDLVRDMRRAVPAGSSCVGGGVSVTGTVRGADGTVRIGSPVGRVADPVGEALGTELGHDHAIAIANAADVGALGEHARGSAAPFDDVIYLHGDVGIGSGIIAGGRPVTGHGGHGGEAGHMVVNPHGRACGCGSRGCWETEIGEQALLQRAGQADATGRDAVIAVIDAAGRGDQEAGAAIRHVADWLGFGVVNLVNIFNPNVVVFGGTLRELYLAGSAQVHSRLSSMALPGREHVRLRTPLLGDDAPLMGAAELAFERLLEDPLVAAG
ncbi:ROK family transcriptional regulator [Planotetraspora kaengkrachanensis]|uniref:Sugar kinase n=1 Tax=Planotetraspora kaengkrachanensis TaxID=575193 RepID=A0A8J3M1W1_9ACTN|nr:ROK family transcriptional regulator [Planotetraspora kaengkrachanensis]GIG77496.1 sugar kinase [Planotetraspora kaengkrachanensis]